MTGSERTLRRMGTTTERVLGRAALNRALLARQLLLRRRTTAPLRAISHLVALQAQEPPDPYVALWSRVEPFDPVTLSRALERRRVIRMTLLRGTLHLVTSADAFAIRPQIQPVVHRTFSGSTPFRRAMEGVDLDELLAFLRRLLEETPRTRAELVAAIAERWPDRDASSLGYAMYLLPTVQVTPRGLWRRSGRSAFTTLDAWLGETGRDDTRIGASDDLVLRYLRAFGPATPADARAWSGLPGMRERFEELRPGLRTFRDEEGRALFDVPRAPLPDPDTPAPVRFLPEYDNVVLAHEDRSRIVGPGTSVWAEVGWGLVLVDGFTTARWRVPKDGGEMAVEPFRRLTAEERDAVRAEGRRLLGFLVPERTATDRAIRIARPS